MAVDKHVAIARQGAAAIEQWRREHTLDDLDLSGADLTDLDLGDADLVSANLYRADLRGANLANAFIGGAYVRQADLRGASLLRTNFILADLREVRLDGARCAFTVFGRTNLSGCTGLGGVEHVRPSVLDDATISTLASCHPTEAEEFLAGCGYQNWHLECGKLANPSLTPVEIAEIQQQLFNKRTTGPLYIGGSFISYSSDDSSFVELLYQRLRTEGATVWLDQHELVAGRLERQIEHALRVNTIVILVLSEASLRSDWVEREIAQARQHERTDRRDRLCPICLDHAWQDESLSVGMSQVLLQQIRKYHVVDFAAWSDPVAFEAQFQRLLKGMKTMYERAAESP